MPLVLSAAKTGVAGNNIANAAPIRAVLLRTSRMRLIWFTVWLLLHPLFSYHSEFISGSILLLELDTEPSPA